MKRILGAVALSALVWAPASAASTVTPVPSSDRLTVSTVPPAVAGAVEPEQAGDNVFGRTFAMVKNVLNSAATMVSRDIDSAEKAISSTVTTVHAETRERPNRSRELRFTVTPEIKKFLSYYTDGRGRGVAIRGIVRSNPLREDAEEIFREEGVPVELIWLAQVESGWRDTAVSPVGAAGIWQFMPATAERFGMPAEERGDFDQSTRAAAKYLRLLADRYDGNWPLAIGAYNCGEGAMDRAIAKTGSRDFWTIARSGALPTETANYVPAVLAASLFGDDPANFELDGREAVADQLSTKKK